HIWVGYFSFFRPHPKTGWEKEKYRSIVKELIYRTISFAKDFRYLLIVCLCPQKSGELLKAKRYNRWAGIPSDAHNLLLRNGNVPS
ncbi:MAG: hypothetical protein ACYTCV_08940, partial [Planctomycetota bacterium]